MYLYIKTNMYTCIHICIYMHACIHTYVRRYVYTHIYIYIYIHSYFKGPGFLKPSQKGGLADELLVTLVGSLVTC